MRLPRRLTQILPRRRPVWTASHIFHFSECLLWLKLRPARMALSISTNLGSTPSTCPAIPIGLSCSDWWGAVSEPTRLRIPGGSVHQDQAPLFLFRALLLRALCRYTPLR